MRIEGREEFRSVGLSSSCVQSPRQPGGWQKAGSDHGSPFPSASGRSRGLALLNVALRRRYHLKHLRAWITPDGPLRPPRDPRRMRTSVRRELIRGSKSWPRR